MKKTIKKRAFISAIAMLIVSAIVLTSSTFAWFSMAKQVEVETMQLNITSPEGIQISANTNAFTTSLNMDDFTLGENAHDRFKADAENTNHFPTVLSPSSSRFFTNEKALPEFFSGSIKDDGKAYITKATDAEGGYVVFDLFVKLGAGGADVRWGESTITCTDNPDVPSAMRIAMVNCGASTDKAAAKDILENIKFGGTGRSICIFEPDAKHHTVESGVPEGQIETTKYVFKAYTGGMTPTGTNKNIINDNDYCYTPTCEQASDQNKANAYFTGVEGINRIRVYIWMEGNDVDCANDVAGSTINVNLILTID